MGSIYLSFMYYLPKLNQRLLETPYVRKFRRPKIEMYALASVHESADSILLSFMEQTLQARSSKDLMNMVQSFRKHICVTSCTSEKLSLYLKDILRVTAWKYNWTEILGLVH